MSRLEAQDNTLVLGEARPPVNGTRAFCPLGKGLIWPTDKGQLQQRMTSERRYNNKCELELTTVAARAIMPGVVFERPQSTTFEGRFPIGSPSMDDFPCKILLRN